MSNPVLWIARSSARSTANYLRKSFSIPLLLPVVMVVVAGFAVAANVGIYAALDSLLGPAFGPDSVLPEADRTRAVGVFVQSQGLADMTVAVLLMMLIPSRSHLAIAARIAGASKWAVAAGETLPVLATLAVVTTSIGIGPFWFIARSQPSPAISMFAFVLLGLFYSVFAFIVRGVGEGIARLARLGDRVAGALGFLLSTVTVALLLVDSIATSLTGKRSLPGRLSAVAWAGETVPTTWLDVLVTAVALLASLILLVAVLRFSASDGTLPGGWKGFSPATVGHPSHWLNFLTREVVLFVRHPVTQVSTLTVVLLAGLITWGVRSEFLPGGAAAYALAFLFAAGAETAYGRTKQFAWAYALVGYGALRQVMFKFGAVFLVQLALLTSFLIATVPVAELAETLFAVVPTFGSLFALAFLCGTILPYSDSAPIGMSLTSVFVIVAEGILLYLETVVFRLPTVGNAILNVAVLVASIASSVAISARRSVLD